MKNLISVKSYVKFYIIVVFALFLFMAGCSKLKNTATDSGSTCGAEDCHVSSVIKGTFPTNTGQHVAHVTRQKISCETCHNQYNDKNTHKNGIINNSGNNSLIVYFNSTQPNATYDVATLTCSNISCHASVDWNASGSSACTAICHQTGNTFPDAPDPTSGDHGQHLAGGQTCTDCHGDYKKSATHADGIQTSGPTLISFDSTSNPNGTYDGTTCASTTCHGNFPGGNNVNPTWNTGFQIDCNNNQCHGANSSGNPTLQDSKHGTHVNEIIASMGLTEAQSCNVCHDGSGYSTATHLNNQIDITFNYSWGSGNITGGSFDTGTNTFNDVTCSNTYCHGNFTGGNIDSVSWNEATTDSGWCGSCHTTAPTTAKHTIHNTSFSNDCSKCHGADYSIAPTPATPANHVNYTKDVPFGYGHPAGTDGNPTYVTASKTCQDVYCHGNFVKVTYNTVLQNPGNDGNDPVWLSGSTAACGSCHGNSGNNYSSVTHGDHTSNSAGYFGQAGKIDSCDVCHNGNTHNDGTLDITFTLLAAKVGDYGGSTSWNSGATTCSDSWCHGNFNGGVVGEQFNTPNWMTSSTGDCGTCHSNTTPTTGSHIKHVTDLNYGCSKCHGSFTDHVDGTIGGAGVTVSFDSTNPNGNWNNPTCENLYCHGNTTGSGDWNNYNGSASANNNDPAWGGSLGTCSTNVCHNTTAASLNTGRHQKHLNDYSYTCTNCHNGNGHADGVLDTSPDGNNPGATFTATTCTGSYCHGTFTGGNSSNVPNWVTGTGGSCATSDCHDKAPLKTLYGSHNKHTDSGEYNFTCDNCHNGVATGNEATAAIASKVLHANFDRTVIFNANSMGTDATADYNKTGKTCSGIYCHGDFVGGNTNVPNWENVTGGSCAANDCHNKAPTSFGKHATHTDAAKYDFDCENCHSGIAYGKESTAINFDASTYLNYHVDFNVDVNFGNGTATAGGYSLIADQGPGVATNATSYSGNNSAPGTGGTCSNTYCHGDFRATDNTQWLEGNNSATGNWNGGTAVCGTCHGTTTGNNQNLGIPNDSTSWHTSESHNKHAGNNSNSGYNYPCGFCHNNTYDATLGTGDGIGGSYETGTKSPTYTLHANGARDFAFYTPFTGTSANRTGGALQEGSCETLYCHSDGNDTTRTEQDNPNRIYTPGSGWSGAVHVSTAVTWGGAGKTTITCTSCHSHYSPDNDSKYTSATTFSLKPAPRHNSPDADNDTIKPKDHYNKFSNSGFDAHVTSCTHCHSKVTTATGEGWSDNSITYANNRHVNRTKNISFGLHTAASGGSYLYDRTGGTCYVDCHTSVGDQKAHSPKTKWYDFGNGYPYPTNDNWTYEP